MSKKIKITLGKREYNSVISTALDYGIEKYRKQVENGEEQTDRVLVFDKVLLTPILNSMNWALYKRDLKTEYNVNQNILVIRRIAKEQGCKLAVDLGQELPDDGILNDHKRYQLKKKLLERIKQSAIFDKYDIVMELENDNKVHAETITVEGVLPDFDQTNDR